MKRALPLLTACLLFANARAAAQGATPPPEYEPLIEEALAESAAGNWEEARAAFRQAHAAFPNAQTERGLGVVSFEIRDDVESVRYLRRALANPVRPLTEEERAEVVSLLAHALGRVALFSLADVPEGAEIVIDGSTVEPEDDGTLMLPIGEHSVVVSGAHGWESTVVVGGGENTLLPRRFEEPEPTPLPEGPRQDPNHAVPSVPPPRPTGSMALTIGGAVGFLAGLGVLIAGIVDYTTVEGGTRDTEWAELSGAYARTPVLQGVGYAAMGLGAALTIGGAIWLSSGNDGSSGAQLRFRGTF